MSRLSLILPPPAGSKATAASCAAPRLARAFRDYEAEVRPLRPVRALPAVAQMLRRTSTQVLNSRRSVTRAHPDPPRSLLTFWPPPLTTVSTDPFYCRRNTTCPPPSQLGHLAIASCLLAQCTQAPDFVGPLPTVPSPLTAARSHAPPSPQLDARPLPPALLHCAEFVDPEYQIGRKGLDRCGNGAPSRLRNHDDPASNI